MKKNIIEAIVIAFVLTVVSFGVALVTRWVTEPNPIEIAATFLNYGAFYLSVKQRRLNYLLGVAASALFIVTYFQVGLLASAGLSAYLTIALFVGFFMWGRDGSKTALRVKHIELKWVPIYLLVTAAAYAGAVLIVTSLGGSFAFWDSAILIFTLLAQFMLDRKKIENWWVWIVGVNIAGTVLYFTIGLYFVAIQQLLFGIASAWGWYEWNKDLKQQKIKDVAFLKVEDRGWVRY